MADSFKDKVAKEVQRLARIAAQVKALERNGEKGTLTVGFSELESVYSKKFEAATSKVVPSSRAQQARRDVKTLQSQLTNLGVCSTTRYVNAWGKEGAKVDPVKFRDPLILTPYGIRAYVDQYRLPQGVAISDIGSDRVLETMEVILGRGVSFHWGAGVGAYFDISDIEMINGIPSILYRDNRCAPNGYMSYVVGMTKNGMREVYLPKVPHLVIGGASTSGKSVHLQHMVVSLAERNPPGMVQIAMCDLKDGVIFWPFRRLPHVWNKIAKTTLDAIQLMADLSKEQERRNAMFREEELPNLWEYNKRHPEKAQPYIVLVIDEIASLTQGEYRKEGNPLLVHLLRTAASAGISVIMATQNPRADVINSDIRANATEAIAFHVSLNTHSHIVIQRGGAEKISVAGRGIAKLEGQYFEFQTPYLTVDDLRNKIGELEEKWE